MRGPILIPFILVTFTVATANAPTQDPLESLQWGLTAIHAPGAWNQLPTNPPHVLVAVIDTGIDWKHPDLSNVTTHGYDFTTDATALNCIDTYYFTGQCPYASMPLDELLGPMDFAGHGTHVAGILAAERNGVGIVGVSQATLIPLKALPSGNSAYSFTENVVAAILAAEANHARIISMSIGTYTNDTTLYTAVESAIHNNIVIVAAAGNENTTAPLYPAAYPGVIAVAAVNQSLQPWRVNANVGSNHGAYVDIAAPGVDILSDGSRWVMSFGLTYRGITYVNMTGTSMATPHVAGVAALVLEANPGIDAANVKSILESTADGQGWNEDVGYGVVNASAAVRLALLTPLNDGLTIR